MKYMSDSQGRLVIAPPNTSTTPRVSSSPGKTREKTTLCEDVSIKSRSWVQSGRLDVQHEAQFPTILLKLELEMRNLMKNVTRVVQKNTENTMWRGEMERLNTLHMWNIYHTTPGNEPISSQQRAKRNVLSRNEWELCAIMFNYMLRNCACCAVLLMGGKPSTFYNSVDFCVAVFPPTSFISGGISFK